MTSSTHQMHTFVSPQVGNEVQMAQRNLAARVLVISQFFGPNTAAVGQFLADAVDAASDGGHRVRVICGGSEYSTLEAGDGETISHGSAESAGFEDEKLDRRAIEVSRVRNLTFSHSRARKLLSYATFYAGATWKALTGPRPDTVLTLTAPPGLAWIGWLMQRVRGSRHVVWEMDVYPDIAVALGIPVVGRLGGLLDYPRRRADVVIALGDCMKARLLRHNIPEERICVAENWADGRKIYPLPFPEPAPLRVLYSGNLGLAHDVATIRGAIERLGGDPTFHFDFAGGGPQRGELEGFCHERTFGNVSFRTYVRQGQLGASLGECHVGLVTQKSATLGAVVPSKIYGLMAAGRPVLYIGPAAATAAHLIGRFDCGWHLECGDVDGVLDLLKHVSAHPEEIYRKGENGRKAFAGRYDKPAGVARICRALGLETTESLPGELARPTLTDQALTSQASRLDSVV